MTATRPAIKKGNMELDYTTIAFTNPTGEDFTWEYGSKPYTIRAGETKHYPVFLAKHLAKHLVNRIIGTASANLRDPERRAEVEKSILGGVVLEAEPQEQMSEGERVARKVEEIEQQVKAKEEAFADLKATDEQPLEETPAPKPKKATKKATKKAR